MNNQSTSAVSTPSPTTENESEVEEPMNQVTLESYSIGIERNKDKTEILWSSGGEDSDYYSNNKIYEEIKIENSTVRHAKLSNGITSVTLYYKQFLQQPSSTTENKSKVEEPMNREPDSYVIGIQRNKDKTEIFWMDAKFSNGSFGKKYEKLTMEPSKVVFLRSHSGNEVVEVYARKEK